MKRGGRLIRQRGTALAATVVAACLTAPVLAQSPAIWQPESDSPVAHSHRLVGSQSCSSVSCHGGDLESESHVYSVYHRWLHDDPHARAGEVLFESLSQQMGQRLGCVDPDSGASRIHLDRRCLACHSPAAVSSGEVNSRLLADGVGCEACHGGAKDWLEPHRSVDWKNPLIWPAERKASVGYRDLENLVIRSRTCAECHVGGIQKDVNHDFIAAGHPRLTYEFSAYDAKIPAHWFRRDDRRRSAVSATAGDSIELRSNYAARAWLVGQWTAAGQQLALLIDRAETDRAPWPELAEYACYSCHQELKDRSTAELKRTNRRPGQLAWNPWTLSLLEHESSVEQDTAGSSEWRQGIKDLRIALEQKATSRSQVAQLATELRGLTDAAAQQAAETTLTADQIRGRLRRLLSAHGDLTDADWETAAQLYLAVAALEQGYFDAAAEAGWDNRLLLRARDDLRFPTRPGEIGDVVRYDSPVNFDRASLSETFEKIADQLGE